MVNLQFKKEFRIVAAIHGSQELAQPETLNRLRDTLQLRAYFKIKEIRWDADSRYAIVLLHTDGYSVDSVSREVAEDLFEAASGALANTDGLRIEILNNTLA